MELATKLFICFYVLAAAVESIQIKCEFRLNSEECKVNSLKILENDTEVTSIVGAHAFRRTNRDVKELWIDRGVETEYAPTNICKFFENIERIDIYGSKVKHVSRQTFKSCQKVSKVCLLFTSLSSLPEDLFEDLTELKELFLYDNKLLYLPEKLIAKNTKLFSFSAKSNQLIMIDIDFSPSVRSIDLRTNKCIDKRFPEDVSSLSAFKADIAGHCESPLKNSMKLKVQEISELQMNLSTKETEIDSLKSEKENFEMEKEGLSSNVSQLMLKNSQLNNEVAERRVEIQAMKKNSTKEIAAVFNENILLKINFTDCQRNIANSSKLLKEIAGKNLVYSEQIKTSQQDKQNLVVDLTSSERKLAQTLSTVELLQASNFNFNESLEECWQNLSLINALNDELKSQILSITKNFTNVIDEGCKHPTAGSLLNDCDDKISFKYFIVLFLTFVTILVASICFMRRRASRMLIRQMVNHQVSMGRLISDEQ